MQKPNNRQSDGLELDNVLIDKINSVAGAAPSDQQKEYDEFTNFISVLAERYKTPLHTVYTAIELIINKEAQNLSDSAKANLRRAQGTLQKVNLLTDDIIAYANVCSTVPSFAPTDLNAVVQNVVHSLSSLISEKMVRINGDKLPVVNGDPLLLVTLFTQIISNCIKFRKRTAKPEILITHSEDQTANMHVIAVKDNSIGFEASEVHSVFNTFYQIDGKEQKGSGLGLAVCRKIMEKHNGNIAAFSAPEAGTTIELRFPFHFFSVKNKAVEI